MTTSDTDVAQDDALRPWLVRAGRLIADRLADARAHAEAGRTFDANQRLSELRRNLLDDQSGQGSLLSNARAAFYRQAFTDPPHDPSQHRELRPEPAAELTARFGLIGGRNQYLDARFVLEEITGSLRGLGDVATTMRNSKQPEHWRAQFDGWQTRSTDGLTAHMHTALSDAQAALSDAVSRVRVKGGPELGR